MRRREFIAALGALGFSPRVSFSQGTRPRFADMHAHLGFRGAGFREPMERGGMLFVAEKVTPDSTLLRVSEGRLRNTRAAQAGEMRRYYEGGLARRRARWRREGMPEVTSVALLDKVLQEKTPAIIISAEGADFLEGDLSYVDRIRADGLVHLQIVHYYAQSLIGDISTEEFTRGGLTAFGKDLVRACNRLGILVDVAHCSTPAMEQALDISTRPIIYSHGQVSAELPSPSLPILRARAIHEPMAKRIAEKGGVVGVWPNFYTYGNIDLLADGLMRLADTLGPRHIGIGTDMNGIPRSVMPSYAEFPALAEALAKLGMKAGEIDGVLGGNYIRVLRQAMAA